MLSIGCLNPKTQPNASILLSGTESVVGQHAFPSFRFMLLGLCQLGCGVEEVDLTVHRAPLLNSKSQVFVLFVFFVGSLSRQDETTC